MKKNWRDWKWQIKNRLTTVDDVVRELNPPEDVVKGIRLATQHFRMAITPYYASLIDFNNPYCPIKAQAIPSANEAMFSVDDMDDPLEEDRDSPVPGLTHRYPDRVLFLVTDMCSMYCRHCTRRRLVGHTDCGFIEDRWRAAVEYISAHTEIRDVIVSGGDPLTLVDSKIECIVEHLRRIPHIEIIRIGTRVPVVNPMRITQPLVRRLKKYHPIYIATHFNHYKEITEESARACNLLADNGFRVENQSVLLRNVNDCPHVMKKLVQKLLSIRARPYYLYQCDLSKGISHFRTSIGKGIQIIESLRGHTSGLAVPTYVVDLPGGGGKVPVMPNYMLTRSDDGTILRNYQGKICAYKEPHSWDNICGHDPACDNEIVKSPAKLLES